MLVYDTSALIEVIEGSPKGENIVQNYGETIVTTTTITAHELFAGAITEKEKMIMKIMLQNFTILPFDLDAAMKSAELEQELRKEKKKVNDADLFIAAICIQNRAKLITCDKGFTKIKALNYKLF